LDPEYIVIATVAIVYIVSIMISPFPCWATYRFLLKTVFLNKDKKIHTRARLRQLAFLLKYLLLNPLWTILWYLDEILFPDYKQQQIRPVFIIGQPRSGTTCLHRTLAEDSDNFYATRHIEWRYPYIIFNKLIKKSNFAKRWLNKDYWPDSNVGKLTAKMHPNKLRDWEEDGIFFEECFLHHFFIFLRFPYPEVLSHVDNFAGLPEKVKQKMLAVHRKVIQKVGYLNNGSSKYYLSKEVTGHDKIEDILKLYPDAKFIVVVRQSREFMNSLLELARYSTLSKTGIDPVDLATWEEIFLERMRQDSSLLTELCEKQIRKSQQVRISFDAFTGDMLDSTRYIYEKIGCQLNDGFVRYLEEKQLDQKNRDKGYLYEKRKLSGFEGFDCFVREVENSLKANLIKS